MPFSAERVIAGVIAGVTVAAALGYYLYSKSGGGDTISNVAAPLTGGGTRRHKKRSKSNRKRPSS